MLRITTAVRGLAARTRRVASMPFMLGIAISITITSGNCSSASRTQSRPSPASATTTMSDCRSRSARRPSRTTVWSSAKRMRMGIVSVSMGKVRERQLGRDAGSAARLGIDLQLPARAADPLLHPEQAQAPDEARIEARAIVANTEDHAVVFPSDLHLHGAGIGVTGSVVHGLLHQPVDTGCVFVGQVV